jgi:hypothetical protein
LLGEARVAPQASCWSRRLTTRWCTWPTGGTTPQAAAGLGPVSASVAAPDGRSAESPAEARAVHVAVHVI